MFYSGRGVQCRLKLERLLIRRFGKEDLDDFYEYARNPNVGPNAGWKPHASKQETKEILRQFVNSTTIWAIVDKNTSKVWFYWFTC